MQFQQVRRQAVRDRMQTVPAFAAVFRHHLPGRAVIDADVGNDFSGRCFHTVEFTPGPQLVFSEIAGAESGNFLPGEAVIRGTHADYLFGPSRGLDTAAAVGTSAVKQRTVVQNNRTVDIIDPDAVFFTPGFTPVGRTPQEETVFPLQIADGD